MHVLMEINLLARTTDDQDRRRRDQAEPWTGDRDKAQIVRAGAGDVQGRAMRPPSTKSSVPVMNEA